MSFFKHLIVYLLCVSSTGFAADQVVAYWSFDSSSNQTFFDITGHGYNALGSGTAGISAGIKGQALTLPSSNCEVYAANSKNDFNLKKFSIECWVNYSGNPLTDISVGAHIFDNQFVASGVRNGYGLYIGPDGIIYFTMSSFDGTAWNNVPSTTVIKSNAWYHIVASYDSLNLKLFVNGILEGSAQNINGYVFSAADTRIGSQTLQDGTKRCFFNGKIDELKLYNYALSSDTVLAHYGPSISPPEQKVTVAYWSFDNSIGSSFPDMTGHGFNAIYSTISPGVGVSLVPGIKGQAVNLPGSNYEIVVANSKDSFNLKKFSIECWYFSNLVPTTYINVGGYIFDQQYVASGVRNGYGLYIAPDGRVNLAMSNADGSDWLQNFSKTALAENRWYHIVGTYDASSLKVYVNGVCESTLPYSGSYLPSGADARIGCQRLMDGTLRCFDIGKIDELKLYNYALPADSIVAHYSVQKPYKINLGMKPCFAKPGDSIWVPIYVTNFENFNISACQFNLHFDTSIVRLTAVSRDSGIAKGWDLIANTAKIDPVPIAMGGLTKAISYGEGELIRCKFVVNPDAKQGSATTIEIQNVTIDENNLVFATTVQGKINIAKPSVMFGDVTGNGEVTALDAARILEFAVGQLSLPSTQLPNFTVTVADVSGDGTVSSYDAALIFQYCVGMLSSFPIQNLPVLAKRAAHTATQAATTTAEVSVSGPISVSQDIFKYIVHAKNLDGFVAGEFSLQCNPDVIVSIKDASPLIKNANFRAQFDSQQKEYFTALTTNDGIVCSETDLISVTVQQKPGIPLSGLTIKNVSFNEGRIPTSIISGPVTVHPLTSMERSGNGISIKSNSISVENDRHAPVIIRAYDMMGRMLFSKTYSSNEKSIFLINPVQSGGMYLWKITRGTETTTLRIPTAGH
jgi:hypothetical protein